jgi:hypothetical protein
MVPLPINQHVKGHFFQSCGKNHLEAIKMEGGPRKLACIDVNLKNRIIHHQKRFSRQSET